ncbi:MAG TPA: M28 family peptidase, partial [Bacteroidia bacterium]|nr:M28 family peptidase [Bacteroidia bacterium]
MLKTKHIVALAAIFSLLVFASCGDDKPGGNGKDPDSIPTVEPFKPIAPDFSADSAYHFIEQQLAFGPRVPNTPAHAACADWMVGQFKTYGAEVMVQSAEIKDRSGKLIQMKNIIASYNVAAAKRVMVTAHWDSRPFADKDAKNPSAPVPGANDGASGVAVILEIARHLQAKAPAVGVDLILWDAEDNGDYNDNNSWCQGSQYWAKHPHKPNYRAAWGVNLDMVGAKDARFTKDAYSLRSARAQTDNVWSIAAQLGYGNYFSGAFTDFASIDDHYFIMEGAGIPMVEVIDRDLSSSEFFPHWHTTADDI